MQGFSTGGEYGGAATFMAEYAPDTKRGFYGSFLEFGTHRRLHPRRASRRVRHRARHRRRRHDRLGLAGAVPVGGPLGLIGLYLRMKLEDTPVFRELEQKTHETEEGASDASSRTLFTNYLAARS